MALVPLHHFLPMGWAALIALCRFGRFGLLASLVTWQQGHCWESHPWIICFFQLVLNSKSLLRMFWYNLGSSDETITVTWWWKINVETVGHEDTCIMLHAAGSCSPSSPLDPPKSPLNPIKSPLITKKKYCYCTIFQQHLLAAHGSTSQQSWCKSGRCDLSQLEWWGRHWKPTDDILSHPKLCSPYHRANLVPEKSTTLG